MKDIHDHDDLSQCRRLFLRDYIVPIRIGVHDFEKQSEQRIIINIDLYVPMINNTPRSDELSEVGTSLGYGCKSS